MQVENSKLNIALVHPQIGPNAGNIGRLCLGVDAALHLVHPLGFSTSDKAVRRAGLDYWKHVNCTEHPDLEHFLDWCQGRRVFGFSARQGTIWTREQFQPGDVLVFGCESGGLPEELLARWSILRIPITDRVRSLNLSNAVAVAAYGALMQMEGGPFRGGIDG